MIATARQAQKLEEIPLRDTIILMETPASFCEGYVLTGGQSARMGHDKALLLWEGRPLAIWMAELVKGVCGSVTLVGSRDTHSELGFPAIEDLFPSQGPLAGIHASLLHSGSSSSLVVGCDMPYLSADFLTLLLETARTADADAVVPESADSQLEPLCAVYTEACLPPIEEALRHGQRKISRLLAQLQIRRLTHREWQPWDRGGKLFCNLNNPEDYQKAQRELLKRNIQVPA